VALCEDLGIPGGIDGSDMNSTPLELLSNTSGSREQIEGGFGASKG